jgi:phosphatidylglycerol lysyltransferase
LSKKGYKVQRHKAPLPGSLLQALQQVSDEWLDDYEMEEVIFSQGMFDRQEIKNHDVITIEDSEARVVGFLNIIPDYSPGEITYDLIRKTADAPGGCMDALIIELIQYAKSKDLQFLNLGMVPMSGIETPDNPAEQVVKFAYERMKRFSNYKGLRDFKEKYATEWLNKYLVYENDFDLVQLPTALNKAMQPLQK